MTLIAPGLIPRSLLRSKSQILDFKSEMPRGLPRGFPADLRTHCLKRLARLTNTIMRTSEQHRARAVICPTENGRILPEIRKLVQAKAVRWEREKLLSTESGTSKVAIELMASDAGSLSIAKHTIEQLTKVEAFEINPPRAPAISPRAERFKKQRRQIQR